MTRRGMMVSLGLACCLGATAVAQERTPRPGGRRGGPGVAPAAGWRFGIQLYTFNRFSFVEALDKAREAGVRAVEGFSWQKISPETGDAQLNYKAPPEAIEKARQKLADNNIRLVGYYIGDWGKDEAEIRKHFEFGKKMGVQFFVGEPDVEQLKIIDKLAQEFGIRLAFHNHPKDPGKPDYKNWDPDQVMALIKPYSRQIGICADTGHMLRSELDPVEGLKKYEGRIVSLHVKDVNEKGAKGKDVPLGTGVGNVKAQLEELKRENFRGFIMIEYESKMEDNLEDVKESLRFLRETARELGVSTGGRPEAGSWEGRGRPREGRQGRDGREGRGRPGRGGRQRQTPQQ